jgi:myo-inositol-1(or 4)-monophosphatase
LAPDPLYLAVAVEAALAAGRIHRQYFRQGPAIHKKGRIDLVTKADLEVEAMFRRLITDRLPGHVVLGEETVATQAELAPTRFRWIIDPVDGTTTFAHGLQFYCVSIALEIDGRIELGVVYDASADELFTAERGEGAWCNGERLHVSSVGALVDALFCTGFPYSVREDRRRQLYLFAAFLDEAQAVRRLGSAALDLCYVAAGRLDGYWEEKIHPWDIAAGALIVQEAGGRATGLAGEPFDAFAGHVMVSNGHLHEAMLELVQQSRENAARGELLG